ncbi:laminin B domain-containing protein [Spirosoma luteum]|uniref:laminin B domain-containing protein n=1 Tax=Spirosoma luteum TaxID=431553 RepID=UPI0003755D71|nr:laminin B domain-containing protein [Spirosoma luteum]
MTPLLSISYHFDNDAQGWQINEAGKGGFQSFGGNPGGCIYAEDISTDAWYFIASNEFIDMTRKAYGLTLGFDLIQSATDAQFNADDVILTGGTTQLTFNSPHNPGTRWTSYLVKLDEKSGWKNGKVNATQKEMQQVLQNLTSIRIRGEYRNGPDRGGLDNVSIR